MKREQKELSLEFINLPETMSELSMEEIRGGRSVDAYMGCGDHHDGTEDASRLMALI
ncbi:hypothetical protein [Porphyromonas gulae]|uniref:hypothetical protein n=1 Tax=Porphyromonas gulae TaxID=111105 RepID=UPI000AB33DCE|nr:hypothetical protein [Porphyromonas gulae]